MARIIFVNRFYWPDEPATAQLLADLAEALASRGHEVIVIAGRPRGAPRAEMRNGVRIERAGPVRREGRTSGAKARDLAVFFAAALCRLAGCARRGDTVVSLTDPPLIGVGAACIARARG